MRAETSLILDALLCRFLNRILETLAYLPTLSIAMIRKCLAGMPI